MKNSIDRTLKLIFDVKENREITLRPYLYDIGEVNNPFNLVFDKEPSGDLYYNSIFIKILSYKSTNQAIDCLSYHYSHYPDKMAFLNFLENEILDVFELIDGGMTLPSDKRKKRILVASSQWVENQKVRLQVDLENTLRNTIETEVIDLIIEIRNAKIDVNPQVDPRKIIILFLTLQRLITDEKEVGVLSFKHTVVLPHLLKYFAPFVNNKIDALRKQTTVFSSELNLRLNSPSYLTEALQKYFFNESIKNSDSER